MESVRQGGAGSLRHNSATLDASNLRQTRMHFLWPIDLSNTDMRNASFITVAYSIEAVALAL